jgi:hypothetical protein
VHTDEERGTTRLLEIEGRDVSWLHAVSVSEMSSLQQHICACNKW